MIEGAFFVTGIGVGAGLVAAIMWAMLLSKS